tara:strand:- start:12456 stop:14483 length:2028 start_codon:yes stop_codon:yes gene_type:complete
MEDSISPEEFSAEQQGSEDRRESARVAGEDSEGTLCDANVNALDGASIVVEPDVGPTRERAKRKEKTVSNADSDEEGETSKWRRVEDELKKERKRRIAAESAVKRMQWRVSASVQNACAVFAMDKSVPSLLVLIRNLPCYQRIRFDTVLNEPVIRATEEAVVWSRLKHNTWIVEDEVKQAFEAFMAYKMHDDGLEVGVDAKGKDLKLISVRNLLLEHPKILEDALPLVVPGRDESRRGHCNLYMQGWRLCNKVLASGEKAPSDMIARFLNSFEKGGEVEVRALRREDHFLDFMAFKLSHADAETANTALKEDGTLNLTADEQKLHDVMKRGYCDEGLMMYEHAKRASIMWESSIIQEKKLFSLEVTETDCGKDRARHNPLRHLAPGVVEVADESFIYGMDRSKLADAHSRGTYSLVLVHPDANLKKLDMHMIRARYANDSESAMRDAYLTSHTETGEYPTLMLYGNYDTYPSYGFPAGVETKALATFSVQYTSDGTAGSRLMKRFLADDGKRISPSQEDREYLPPSHAVMLRKGEEWKHARTYGSWILKLLVKMKYDWNKDPRNANAVPWDPEVAATQQQRENLVNYQKHRSINASAITYNIPNAPLNLSKVGACYDTSSDALDALVRQVSDLVVNNVPGRWITPMVSLATNSQKMCDLRSAIFEDRRSTFKLTV